MGNITEGPNKEPRKDVSKTWNILITPLFSYDNSEIIKKDTFHKHILSKRSVIINLLKGPNSNPKADAEFIVSLYRLRLNALSAKGDFADIQETVEDYNSWMKYIIRAGGFDRAFDIFTVSKEDIKQLRKVLEEITTSIKTAEPSIASESRSGEPEEVKLKVQSRGPRIIKFIKYVRSGWTPAWGQKAALHGSLLDLDREYPSSPFAE